MSSQLVHKSRVVNFLKVVILMITATSCVLGCKKRDPNPHLLDPIYSDLQNEAKIYEQATAEAKKKIESAEKALEKSEPRTIDRRAAQDDLLKAKMQLQKAEELFEYYQIRILQREIDAKKSYNAAFDKGEDWPNKNEIEEYKFNKKMVSASRNWSDRVPNPSKQQKPGDNKPDAAAASGGGH